MKQDPNEKLQRKTPRDRPRSSNDDREAHESRKVRRGFQDRVDQLKHMEMLDLGEDL